MKIRFAIFCAALFWAIPANADEAPGQKAAKTVAEFFAKRKVLEDQAAKEIAALKAAATKALLASHDELMKADRRREAEQVLAQLVLINTEPQDIITNPSSLSNFSGKVGKQVVVLATGQVGGSVWGTDVYTADSSLPGAAVHTGVLRKGETALLLATMVPGRDKYQGTNRNGVKSSDYGKYATSYQLMRIGPVPQPLEPEENKLEKRPNEEDAP